MAAGLGLLPYARVSGQSVGPFISPATAAEKRLERPAPRVAEYGAIESPLVVLPARLAAADRIGAMEAWNRSGHEPVRVGFSRTLPSAIGAELSNETADSHSVQVRSTTGSIVWGTRVTVQEAYGVRFHLSGVHLPPGTRFWTYGTEGTPVSFGLELLSPGGDLWTPISFGETAFLDVEVPKTGPPGGFSILEVAELRPTTTAAEPACAIDAICATPAMFSFIDDAMKAVAVLVFSIAGGNQAQCTGTLLNDAAEDGVPYLLTANHCISTQDSATSLTAYWDYHAPSCGGAVPDFFTLPTSSGATLLANDAKSDFSFLRLNSVPAGRVFMGWNASSSAVPQNTTLFRVSCPNPSGTVPLQQQLTQYDAVFPTTGCLGADFIASQRKDGYAFEGSSGSAAMLANGQVVGQLYGTCANAPDPCTVSFTTEDGAFSLSYPSIAQWLSAPSKACVPSSTALCLNTRFKVTALWQKPDGSSGPGTAVSLTPDTGYFWFFDPSNVEVVTKVLNGCGVNGRYWVFSSGLTNVGVTLTYTDLSTGTPKSYQSAVGTAFPPTQDTTAFATCP